MLLLLGSVKWSGEKKMIFKDDSAKNNEYQNDFLASPFNSVFY